MRRAPALRAALLGLLCATGAIAGDLNDAGRAAYERGDYVTAERLFRQAATQSPDDPLVYYHRGVTLMRLARWREAAAAFDTVLKLNPPADLAATTREGIRSLAPLLREPMPRRARSEEILVTLHRAGGNWLADVRLNDSRTTRFVVDTGASACVISPELATALRIHPAASAEQVPMQVVGGVTAGRRVTIASVRVGDAEADNVDAIVHSIGPGIDGLLGNTFLGRFTVTLDPAKGVLVLRPR